MDNLDDINLDDFSGIEDPVEKKRVEPNTIVKFETEGFGTDGVKLLNNITGFTWSW